MWPWVEPLALVVLALLGSLALVRHYGVSVDETLPGTVLAFERHADPNDPENRGQAIQVGFAAEEPHQAVYLASTLKPDRSGAYEWTRVLADNEPEALRQTERPYLGEVLSADALEARNSLWR